MVETEARPMSWRPPPAARTLATTRLSPDDFRAARETALRDTDAVPRDSYELGVARTDPIPLDEQADLPPLRVTRGPAAARGDGEFQVVGTLGEGGMAVVELAKQPALSREVALKTALDRAGETAVSLMLREARVMGAVAHPNVVPVHALGVDPSGKPVLVMKCVEGTLWRTLLADPEHPQHSVPRERRLLFHLGVLGHVSRALELAHKRGVIHRDVKPENVMIGETGEVYLLDWGIALVKGEPDPFRGSTGTPAYMAPEMIEPALGPIDERTDVYQLGATLHEILTGKPRHDGHNAVAALVLAYNSPPARYAPTVPPELGEIANHACSRDPKARFETARAFREALEAYAAYAGTLDLVAAAEERLATLEQIAAGGAPHGAQPRNAGGASERLSEAEPLFLECRFGFEQARRASPTSRRAKSGLRRTVVAMVEVSLSLGDVSRAKSLAGTLDDEPELLERVREAEQDQEKQQERLADLAARGSQLDWRVAARERAKADFIQGIACVLVGAGWDGAHRAGVEMTFERLGATFLLWSIIGVFVTRARRDLRSNRASFGIALIFFILLPLLAALICGLVKSLGHTPYDAVMVILFTGLGMFLALGAVFFRPYWAAAVSLPIAMAFSLLWPDHFFLHGATAFGSSSFVLAGIWLRISQRGTTRSVPIDTILTAAKSSRGSAARKGG